MLVLRHLGWLTALRHAMRQPRRWEVANEHRTNREWNHSLNTPERLSKLEEEMCGLLPKDEEQRVLARTNRPAAILFEQSRHLRELEQRGLIWEFAFLEMQSTLQELFELQGRSERIKNFPYPRQYATLGFHFVRLFLVFIPFAAVPEFARIGDTLEAGGQGLGHLFVWLAVPFSVVMSWMFHAMERIGRVGENPFEGTPNDIPISTMARGIEIDLRELLGQPPGEIPGPLPEVRNVQM